MDFATVEGNQKIVPSLLFVNEKQDDVKKALKHYQSIFPNSSVILEAPYPENSEKLLFAQFKLNNSTFNAMSSTIQHDFDFTPGVSLVVQCETQTEIDQYWEKLGENGKYNRCGWLDDQFGVSWQIVPTVLSSLMSNPTKAQAVTQAFMQMTKFDIETLMNA